MNSEDQDQLKEINERVTHFMRYVNYTKDVTNVIIIDCLDYLIKLKRDIGENSGADFKSMLLYIDPAIKHCIDEARLPEWKISILKACFFKLNKIIEDRFEWFEYNECNTAEKKAEHLLIQLAKINYKKT